MMIFFTQLFISSAWSKPCGLEGSIEERIKDCDLTKNGFSLIHRDEKGREIYKDTKSGLIWGDRISFDFNHYGSQKACDTDVPEEKVLKLKWRLPTIREFEQAAANGMKSALPNMIQSYWSSTPASKAKRKTRRRRAEPASVFLWDANEERTATGTLLDGASVRCVAKE